MLCFSLDIGGSSVKSAICDVTESRVNVVSACEPLAVTSRDFTALKALILDAVDDALRSEAGITAVALSTTGAVNRGGRVLSAGHFHGYEDISWAEILKGQFPALSRVVTVNDGKASTWAEYCHLDEPSEVFAHFVVGTGVGGGLVCFDKLLCGDDETAGALGHMKVDLCSRVVCSCGRTGCVETVASGPSILRAYSLSTSSSEPITLDAIAELARRGNSEAIDAFTMAGSWLGVAISNIINLLNPRFITVGGGVLLSSSTINDAEGGPYLQAAITRAHELAFEDIAAATRIVIARYGNNGGLLGAALLASGVNQA